jgi:hypothetical protein
MSSDAVVQTSAYQSATYHIFFTSSPDRARDDAGWCHSRRRTSLLKGCLARSAPPHGFARWKNAPAAGIFRC